MGRKGRDMLAAFARYMQTFIGVIVCDFEYTHVFAENRKRKQLKCFSCQIDDIILILPSKVVITVKVNKFDHTSIISIKFIPTNMHLMFAS
jgi:hypothetical protein